MPHLVPRASRIARITRTAHLALGQQRSERSNALSLSGLSTLLLDLAALRRALSHVEHKSACERGRNPPRTRCPLEDLREPVLIGLVAPELHPDDELAIIEEAGADLSLHGPHIGLTQPIHVFRVDRLHPRAHPRLREVLNVLPLELEERVVGTGDLVWGVEERFRGVGERFHGHLLQLS